MTDTCIIQQFMIFLLYEQIESGLLLRYSVSGNQNAQEEVEALNGLHSIGKL